MRLLRLAVVRLAVVRRGAVLLRRDAVTRRRLGAVALAGGVTTAAAALEVARAESYQSGLVFEGGAGGLGKPRPVTGVQKAEKFVDRAAKKAGTIGDLLEGSDGLPVEVAFEAPWPVGADGVSARDYLTGDAAYVLVARAKSNDDLRKTVEAAVFAQNGKYGAYGAPTDIRLRARRSVTGDVVVVGETFEYTFVALTPAMREVERRIQVRAVPIGADAFVLVVGTTAARWAKANPTLRTALETFVARPAADDSAEMRIFRNRQRRTAAADSSTATTEK